MAKANSDLFRQGLRKCSHCHRIFNIEHFYSNRGYLCRSCTKIKNTARYQAAHDLLIKTKARPCMDCGIVDPPYVMDFDHRDRTTKLFLISESLTKPLTVLQAEMDKCDVVCANCHRERTYKSKYWQLSRSTI